MTAARTFNIKESVDVIIKGAADAHPDDVHKQLGFVAYECILLGQTIAKEETAERRHQEFMNLEYQRDRTTQVGFELQTKTHEEIRNEARRQTAALELIAQLIRNKL